MNLIELREKVKVCQHYQQEAGRHICTRSRTIANFCWAFEDRETPDICERFRETGGLTVKQIDEIWRKARKPKRSKYDARRKLQDFILRYLEEKKTFTQKEIIESARSSGLARRVIQYHWRAVMEALGLSWSWRKEGHANFKEYKIKWRDLRVLRRRLREA